MLRALFPTKHIHSVLEESKLKREDNVWRAHAQYYTASQIVMFTSSADRAAARKMMDV